MTFKEAVGGKMSIQISDELISELHSNPYSTLQSEEQPSPSTLLPSSHSYCPKFRPSPQISTLSLLLYLCTYSGQRNSL